MKPAPPVRRNRIPLRAQAEGLDGRLCLSTVPANAPSIKIARPPPSSASSEPLPAEESRVRLARSAAAGSGTGAAARDAACLAPPPRALRAAPLRARLLRVAGAGVPALVPDAGPAPPPPGGLIPPPNNARGELGAGAERAPGCRA